MGDRGKEGGEMERGGSPARSESVCVSSCHLCQSGILRAVAELDAGPSALTHSTGPSNDMKNFHTEVSGQESSRSTPPKKKKIKTQTRKRTGSSWRREGGGAQSEGSVTLSSHGSAPAPKHLLPDLPVHPPSPQLLPPRASSCRPPSGQTKGQSPGEVQPG